MGGDDTTGRTGRTLEAELEHGPMRAETALRVASSVADEVAALHAVGRAHGGIGAATVAVADDGSATLVGPPAPKTGLAAPPALRSDDLHGVGRVLAAALGWPGGGALPAPVADLVERAEDTAAPAATLATALRRLEHEPATLAALLTPTPPPLAAGRVGGVLRMIPRADRRITGTAAVVVAGIAAVGAVLLLVGTPASTSRAPAAAAEAGALHAAETPDQAADVAVAEPDTVQAILRPEAVRPAPAAPRPASRSTTPAAEAAVPASAPTSVPAASTRPTTSPTPTVAPTTSAPTAQPTTTPGSTGSPTPATSSPAPTAPPSAAPTTAPTAVPTPAATAPTPTATTAG